MKTMTHFPPERSGSPGEHPLPLVDRLKILQASVRLIRLRVEQGLPPVDLDLLLRLELFLEETLALVVKE
jgi:hypothetical protein